MDARAEMILKMFGENVESDSKAHQDRMLALVESLAADCGANPETLVDGIEEAETGSFAETCMKAAVDEVNRSMKLRSKKHAVLAVAIAGYAIFDSFLTKAKAIAE